MAVKTDLDTLVLNIEVNDKKDGKSAAHTINELTRSLAKFQATIQGLNTTVFRNKFSAMATAVKPFVAQLEEAKGKIADLNKLAKILDDKRLKDIAAVANIGKQKVAGDTSGTADNKGSSGVGQNIQTSVEETKTKNASAAIDELSDKYGSLSKSITTSDNKLELFFDRIEGNNKVTTKFTADLDKNGKVIESSLTKVNEVAKNVAGDGLKSFFLSIKRIALYRAIRTALKVIVQNSKEGIRNVAQFDATANKSLSQIKSSFVVLQNSIGAVLMPLLQLVTPVIQGIAKAIGTLANGISYLIAKLRGQSEWLKVNTDYYKEYNKQANKLSYDEFSVLSADDTSGMFTKESMSVTGQISKDVQSIAGVIVAIGTAFAAWEATKLFKWIFDGGVGKLFDKVSSGIKGITKGVTTLYAKIQPMALVVGGLALIVQSIFDILNWDETTSGLQKVFNVLTLIAGVVAVVCGFLAAFLPTGAAKIAKAIAFGAVLVGTITGVGSMVSKHADGGMFEGTGTIYHQAGEAGAEIVATGSRGTGVANVQQIEEAFYNALYKYNAAKQVQSNGDVVIKIDGRELARQQVRNNADALRQNYNIKLEPR